MLAGGTVAATALLAGCGGGSGSSETAKFGDGDAGILNYFLFLEQEQVAMYSALIASGQFRGSELTTLREFLAQEREHISHVTRLLRKQGGATATPTRGGFLLSGQGPAALAQAGQFENLVASAYLGQLARIKDRAVLAAALAIGSVEGRHAAAIAVARGSAISPDGASAKPASAADVTRSIKTGVGG